MRHAILPILLLSAGAAQAHPGHLAEVAGHGHWLGAAAIGAAIAIGLWAAAKGRRDAAAREDGDEAEEAEAEDELQEA
jgi:hypothetical protein